MKICVDISGNILAFGSAIQAPDGATCIEVDSTPPDLHNALTGKYQYLNSAFVENESWVAPTLPDPDGHIGFGP